MQEPSTQEIEKWNRWFAIECNNLAWTLAENPDRTPEQREAMLHAAHAAEFHWNKVGNEQNKARADMLLGLVHRLSGNASLAMLYAQRSQDYFTSHECPDWEKALSYAVLAGAAHASGEMALYSEHYTTSKSIGEAIADPEDKAVFQLTFIQVPTPQCSPVE